MKKQVVQVLKSKLAKNVFTLSVVTVCMSACSKDKYEGTTNPPSGAGASVLAAAGDSSTIIGTINVFRSLLGDSLNTTPGKTRGRREVNWDAVPAKFTNADNFSTDFFNSTLDTDPAARKRGLVLQNIGFNFRVDSTDFSSVDALYANQFETFSKKRLFNSANTNITVLNFKVPGTATNAFIRGFGVVFSDVDDDNSTTLEFFNGNTSLGIFKAPSHPASGNFSFLGVKFKDAKVTSVKITSGNGSLGSGIKDVSNGGTKDLVVMDDFFYNEPAATN